MFDPGSRSKLTVRDAPRFPGETLFDRLARVVCDASCLPRKELYEAWEVARRTHRRFRGGRVVDFACGHGLLAHVMLLLDPTLDSAVAVDLRMPASAPRLTTALAAAWPRLSGRVTFVEGPLSDVPIGPDDLVVSAHACGPLTDAVLDAALGASARVAVLPCCHDALRADRGGLDGWLDPSLAIDVTRAARLRAHGYTVHTQHIPEAITPKNRLLLGSPPLSSASRRA